MELNIDISKLQLPNGRTLEKQMQYEAKRFLQILQEEIDKWYSSYSPTIYQRTYAMQSSVYADDVVSVSSSGMQLTAKINYTDAAYHSSLFGGADANTLLLMNSGYQVHSGRHQNIPYFGYRGGGHFLESAMERFNASNEFGIIVEASY